MANNLDKMNRAELLRMQKDVEQALKNADAKAKQDARKAAEKAVAEFGFTLDEIFGVTGGRKRKSASPAKYRNPDNHEETWSGRGRKPGWLNAAVAAGVDISDLEI